MNLSFSTRGWGDLPWDEMIHAALDSYVVTSGNTISATAHMKLKKLGKTVEGVSLGDCSLEGGLV